MESDLLAPTHKTLARLILTLTLFTPNQDDGGDDAEDYDNPDEYAEGDSKEEEDEEDEGDAPKEQEEEPKYDEETQKIVDGELENRNTGRCLVSVLLNKTIEVCR